MNIKRPFTGTRHEHEIEMGTDMDTPVELTKFIDFIN
jgi:hypothetical protein